MQMYGTGIDIIEVTRIKNLLQKNAKIVFKIFTKEEIDYCQNKKNKWQHFAVRFAAKEAVIKAVGNRGVNLKDISINNEENGQPKVVLNGTLKHLQGRLVISLSHCKSYAVAQAILLK